MKKSKYFSTFFSLIKEDLLMELYDWQRKEFDEIASKIVANSRLKEYSDLAPFKVAFCGAYGAGKTTILAFLVLFHVLHHWACNQKESYNCVVLSGTRDQLSSVLWSNIRMWGDGFKNELFTIGSTILKVKNSKMFRVRAKTFNPDRPLTFAGTHATNLMAMFDEGTAISDLAYSRVENFFTNCRGTWMISGNPTSVGTIFYEAMTRPLLGWKAVWVSRADLFDESEDAYSKEVIVKYGRESMEYRVGVLGKFPDSLSDSVFPQYIIERAVERDGFYDWESLGSEGKTVFGIDVSSGEAADYSCVVIRNRIEVLSVTRGHLRYANLIKSIIELVRNVRPVAIAIDEVGIGMGVYKSLQEELEGVTYVMGVNGCRRATAHPFRDLRSQLYIEARNWLVSRGKIPRHEEFIGELRRIQLASANRVAPKKKSEKSPDMADAFSYSFAVDGFLYD